MPTSAKWIYGWTLTELAINLSHQTPPKTKHSTLIGGAALLHLAGWARGFQLHHHLHPHHHLPSAYAASATRRWIRPSSTQAHPAAAAADGGSTTTTTSGSSSSTTTTSPIESNRKGYFRTFDLAGSPPVDPIVRGQVRERLRAKRREPFSKEKGQEVLQLLSDSRCV